MPVDARELDPVIRQKALEILRKRFEPAEVAIDSVEFLSEPTRRNVLLRISLKSTSESVPKSVIFKQSLPELTAADDKNVVARFFRDWAGSEFSSIMQQRDNAHNVPAFYGSDKEHRFILIEDLGSPHVSLVDSLALPDRDNAISALERYMKALGSFNAASFKQTDRYEALLKEINEKATTPQEDLNSLSKEMLPGLGESLNVLNLSMTDDITHDVQHVLASIFAPGPFTVLAHSDIALDNVFDHGESKGLQLIDFEWSSPRSALLDGTYLRMSMPTAWFAKAIPDDVLKPLELIYRNELAKKIPHASNDLDYSTAYTHACAYHALHHIWGLSKILNKDEPWGSGPLPEGSLWDPATNLHRPRFLSRVQTFIDVATEHNRLHSDQPPILTNLIKIAEEMLVKVKEHWPKDTKPLDYFPAFKPASLQAIQTPQKGAATGSDKELSTDAGPADTIKQYKAETAKIRQAEPDYMASTESSRAKEREKYSPCQTTPKPPWRSS